MTKNGKKYKVRYANNNSNINSPGLRSRTKAKNQNLNVLNETKFNFSEIKTPSSMHSLTLELAKERLILDLRDLTPFFFLLRIERFPYATEDTGFQFLNQEMERVNCMTANF